MSAAEWEWEALSVAAIEARAAGESAASALLWSRAAGVARQFPFGDPRRGAAFNNEALGHYAQRDFSAAADGLGAARTAWVESRDFVMAMEIPVGARSSLFHLRMEQRHRDGYERFKRSRFEDLIGGAHAITMVNLALVHFARDDDAAADALLVAAAEGRRDGFGRSDPDLAVILALLAGRLDMQGRHEDADVQAAEARRITEAPARTALELWHAERPRGLNDVRRVLGAAYLTVMADPGWGGPNES